jgi:hypothetical protein
MNMWLSGGESGQGWDDPFRAVEGWSRAIRGGCLVEGASVLTWEQRQQDEVLPEDEAEATSSSWLHEKEVWHGAAAWWHRPEEKRH